MHTEINNTNYIPEHSKLINEAQNSTRLYENEQFKTKIPENLPGSLRRR